MSEVPSNYLQRVDGDDNDNNQPHFDTQQIDEVAEEPNTMLSIDEKCKLIIYGYINHIQNTIKLSNIIPKGIFIIIFEFYKTFFDAQYYEISEKEFHKFYVIENNNKLNGLDGWFTTSKFTKIIRKNDNMLFGLKKFKIDDKSEDDINSIRQEIAILSKLSSDWNTNINIIKLINWFETKKEIFLIVEYCDGGDVFEQLLQKKCLNEKISSQIIKGVANGLIYIHNENIVNRDLKCGSLMFCKGNIKIVDFLLCGNCENKSLTTPVGTAHYVAPEVLPGHEYKTKADLWSLGVIMYMLLVGFPPFFDALGNQQKLFQLIKSGKFEFPSPYWDNISDDAKDLIRNLLIVDVNKRFTAKQVLEHKWIEYANSLSL